MGRARNRPDFVAVNEVKGDDSTPTAGDQPGEEECVGVEKRAAADPAEGRGCVDVEVPELANTQGL